MNYLSVCSGIEAATVAWHPLGWTPVAFSEIEPFPCDLLAHRYPHVPNWGDMTKFKEWPDADIDVLVGGTPCQSFSVAGLRKGLDDPRGNLALTYLAIADKYRPEWLVFENVPGVLSSWSGDEPPGDLEEGQEWEATETSDFGCLLAGMAELGYGFAYRVLDAQYVRVDGFGRAVPQRRRRVFVIGCAGDWRRAAAVLFDAESLRGNSAPRRYSGANVAALTANGVGTCGADDNQGQAGHLIAHTLRGDGFDASEDGTGRGTPIVATSLRARDGTKGVDSDCTDTLVQTSMGIGVRRLLPVECERLQGFPDSYTDIPRGKKRAADGPRYKALGNSMAVNCMRWIGQSIQMASEISQALREAS